MSDVSPGDQDGDGTGLDVLEDGDCLAEEGNTVL